MQLLPKLYRDWLQNWNQFYWIYFGLLYQYIYRFYFFHSILIILMKPLDYYAWGYQITRDTNNFFKTVIDTVNDSHTWHGHATVSTALRLSWKIKAVILNIFCFSYFNICRVFHNIFIMLTEVCSQLHLRY